MTPEPTHRYEYRNDTALGNERLWWEWDNLYFIVILDGMPIFQTQDFDVLCERFLFEKNKLTQLGESRVGTSLPQEQNALK